MGRIIGLNLQNKESEIIQAPFEYIEEEKEAEEKPLKRGRKKKEDGE